MSEYDPFMVIEHMKLSFGKYYLSGRNFHDKNPMLAQGHIGRIYRLVQDIYLHRLLLFYDNSLYLDTTTGNNHKYNPLASMVTV